MTDPPTLRLEKRLLRAGHVLVCGCDEVGRGALAGPVTVGMVLVDAGVRRPLVGVRDSKLLTPPAREVLVPRIRRWARASAVGHASAGEVDRHGLVAALCLAGRRALVGLGDVPDVVLLDGNHDWLSAAVPDGVGPPAPAVPVVTAVKADQRCASVAAASVLAKTARDAIMTAMAADHPAYGWHENKGYASAFHRRALADVGPCAEHRRTWRLVPPDGDGGLVDAEASDDEEASDDAEASVDAEASGGHGADADAVVLPADEVPVPVGGAALAASDGGRVLNEDALVIGVEPPGRP